MSSKTILTATKSPALPYSPSAYSPNAADTTNNILRQYFLTIDGVTGSLLSPSGGRFLSSPHIAASDAVNQYAIATNTPTKVLWNTLDSGLGFLLNVDSTATPEYSGVYKIDYSLQFVNTDSQIQDVYVWLAINGVNLPSSASKFSITNRHGSLDGLIVSYSSVTFKAEEGDVVALYWATTLAYNPTGPADGVYIQASPAQVSPFAVPSIPSAIGSFVMVSGEPL